MVQKLLFVRKSIKGVCKFHIDLEENQLLIGLTEGEFENEPADENASYSTLFDFGVRSQIPSWWGIESGSKNDLQGEDTNTIQFKVKLTR